MAIVDATKSKKYAFVMRKMLGWGTARDLEDYNREYILRNDEDAARYYRKILSP